MIVGFDIDGTITKHPVFFSFLTHALVEKGHTVLIITTRNERYITENDLEKWSIKYTELHVADYSENEDLDKWKACICQELGVEIFFEDDPDVIRLLDKNVISFVPSP